MKNANRSIFFENINFRQIYRYLFDNKFRNINFNKKVQRLIFAFRNKFDKLFIEKEKM